MFKIVKTVFKDVLFDAVIDQAKDLVGVSTPSKKEKKIIKEKQVILNKIINRQEVTKVENVTNVTNITENHEINNILNVDYSEVIEYLNKENEVLYENLNKLRGRFTRSLIFWLGVQTALFIFFIDYIIQYFVLLPRIAM